MKRNKTPQAVKPKNTSSSGQSKWVKTAAAVANSRASSKGSDEEGVTTASSDAEAIKQIGDAGASIAKTYKEKQAAKSSSSGSSSASKAR